MFQFLTAVCQSVTYIIINYYQSHCHICHSHKLFFLSLLKFYFDFQNPHYKHYYIYITTLKLFLILLLFSYILAHVVRTVTF